MRLSRKPLVEIERIEAIEVRPDDVIVVRYQGSQSAEDMERVKDALVPVFPNNTVVVVDSGAEIELHRPAIREEFFTRGERMGLERARSNDSPFSTPELEEIGKTKPKPPPPSDFDLDSAA